MTNHEIEKQRLAIAEARYELELRKLAVLESGERRPSSLNPKHLHHARGRNKLTTNPLYAELPHELLTLKKAGTYTGGQTTVLHQMWPRILHGICPTMRERATIIYKMGLILYNQEPNHMHWQTKTKVSSVGVAVQIRLDKYCAFFPDERSDMEHELRNY